MRISEKFPSESIKYKNRESDIKFTENKRLYNVLNPERKEILGIKVDNGLICDKSIRCDYSLIVENDICFLIELKGADVSYASEQIMNTRMLFLKKYGVEKFVARIICSKVKTAELHSHAYKKLALEMKKLNKQFNISYTPIIQKTDKLVETI